MIARNMMDLPIKSVRQKICKTILSEIRLGEALGVIEK